MKKESRRKAVAIYISIAFSFLLGDLVMAIGKNVFCWSAAAVAASLPIPFVMANQNAILYRTIPVGIILGGYLADHVFEPFMASGSRLAEMLGMIVGNSAGSGMAVMFLCTGICGFMVSMASCFNRETGKLN